MGGVSVGGLLSTTFRVLSRNILPFGIIAVVINLIPILMAMALGQSFVTDPDALSSGFQEDFSSTFGLIAAWWLLSLLLGQFLTATLISGTVQDLRGERVHLGDCLGRAVRVIGPVMAVAILMLLAVFLGMILLLVPGIMVMVMLYVAVPVAVVERPGIFASLGRSRELTKGYRWHLFFVLVVVVGLSMVIQFVWNAIPPLGWAIDLTAGVAIQAFVGALLSVVSAVAYLSLRQAKEGVDVDEIAAVFD